MIAIRPLNQVDQCDKTAEEIPDLPIPELTGLFAEYALYWTRLKSLRDRGCERTRRCQCQRRPQHDGKFLPISFRQRTEHTVFVILDDGFYRPTKRRAGRTCLTIPIPRSSPSSSNHSVRGRDYWRWRDKPKSAAFPLCYFTPGVAVRHVNPPPLTRGLWPATTPSCWRTPDRQASWWHRICRNFLICWNCCTAAAALNNVDALLVADHK